MAFPFDLIQKAAPIPTRKALLALDLQNDFVKPDGACFVRNCPDFLGRVAALAESFRDADEPVVWVQSVFDGRRRPVVNPATGADAVFLSDGPSCSARDGRREDTPDGDGVDKKKSNRKKLSKKEEDIISIVRNDFRDYDDGGVLDGFDGPDGLDGLDGPDGLLEADSNPSSDEDEDDDDDYEGSSPFSTSGPLTFSDDPEAFLSVPADDDVDVDDVDDTDDDINNGKINGKQSKRKPTRCCVPKTAGSQFPAPILAAIDRERDTVLVKCDYSAFQSPAMLPALRNSFVNEVFICGSLSNISVYATVLDAVSQGLAVTLIEDCLGYRNFGLHVSTMRYMADVMGVDGITSDELLQEQDLQETERRSLVAQPPPRPAEAASDAGIESDLDVLNVQTPLQPQAPSPSPPPPLSQQPQRQQPRPPTARKGAGPRLQHRKPRVMRPSTPSTPRDEHPKKKITMASPDVNHSNNNNSTNMSRSSSTEDFTATTPPSEPIGWSKRARNAAQTTLGPGDCIGEGDSRVTYDLPLPADAFDVLMQEVDWQKMYHMSGPVPRLVAVQGVVQPDGAIPIYRHPADESPSLFPFTPTVDAIRVVVERQLGHPLNHVLIQLYRDGQDSISEHSDKTLDIARGTYICNVSLGAQRTMTLRTKKSAAKSVPLAPPDPQDPAPARQSQRVPLPHNSLFVLGETTNMRWLHGIRPDKRPQATRAPEELAFNGQRISLTFRQIATFVNPHDDTIWGQGARSKSPGTTAGKIVHGDPTETERLIRAFGQENQSTEFDWPAHYGSGFDVVNFVTTAPAKVVLPTGFPDRIDELRVRLCLAENGVRYDIVEFDELPDEARASVAEAAEKSDGQEEQPQQQRQPIFLDPDGVRCVSGSIDILTHIGIHRRSRDVPDPEPPIDGYPRGIRLRASAELLKITRNDDGKSPIEVMAPTVSCFNGILNGKSYIPGTVFGIDDCALWPTMWNLGKRRPEILNAERYPHLAAYHARVARRGCVRNVMAEMGLSI